MAEALNGIKLGLILALIIGPVFFALIQTSISKGFLSGLFMAVGIILSDATAIAITYFGVSVVSKYDHLDAYLGILGGVIMLVFGVNSLFKSSTLEQVEKNSNSSSDYFKLALKGYALNGINPFVIIFWLGVSSMVTLTYEYTNEQALIYFVAAVVTVFSTDVLKSYLAGKLKNIVTPKFMNILNKVVGIALIIFSFRLFYFAFKC